MPRNATAVLPDGRSKRANQRIIKWGILAVILAAIVVGTYLEAPKLIDNYNATHLYHNPIFSQIKQLGGSEICNSGNSGYAGGSASNNNPQPWYQAYYWLPSSANLTAEVKKIADRDGYPLNDDEIIASALQSQGGGVINAPFPGGTAYSPSSSYLIGHTGLITLSIILNRQTDVAVNCSNFGDIEGTGKKVIAIVTVLGSWKPTSQQAAPPGF